MAEPTNADLMVLLEERKGKAALFEQDVRNSLATMHMQITNVDTQARKTNGTVADVKTVLQYWKGFTAALSIFIMVILLPLSAWLLSQTYALNGTLDKRISTAITNALVNYGLIRK